MASSNIKIFDENKVNMKTDEEYAVDTQRLNGVQTGVASSTLQNKSLYQVSLMAYALAQLMNANGYDANDSAAVSTFVSNLSSSLLQKVADKATNAEVSAGTSTNKYVTPAGLKSIMPLSVANGGTGKNTLTSGYALIGNGTGAVNFRQILTAISGDSTALPNTTAVKNYVTSQVGSSRTAIETIINTLSARLDASDAAIRDYIDMIIGAPKVGKVLYDVNTVDLSTSLNNPYVFQQMQGSLSPDTNKWMIRFWDEESYTGEEIGTIAFNPINCLGKRLKFTIIPGATGTAGAVYIDREDRSGVYIPSRHSNYDAYRKGAGRTYIFGSASGGASVTTNVPLTLYYTIPSTWHNDFNCYLYLEMYSNPIVQTSSFYSSKSYITKLEIVN